jgi:hypothetical protein
MAWRSGAYNWMAAYGAQGPQMLIDFGNDLHRRTPPLTSASTDATVSAASSTSTGMPLDQQG